MKRLTALLLSLAMLACLTACGKDDGEAKQSTKSAAKSAAKSGELYTFAGLKWDTPISECEAALEKGTGVGFVKEPNGWGDSLYFVAEPGYYSVLGMPLDTKDGNGFIRVYYGPSEAAEERGEASYDNDADWELISVVCGHYVEWPRDESEAGIDMEDWAPMQDVIDNVIRKYGEPDLALIRNAFDDEHYSVPAKECPYIMQDGYAFAQAQGWDGFHVEMTFRNVCLFVGVTAPGTEYGVYSTEVQYYAYPTTEFMADKTVFGAFPLLNGEPEYLVIDP